MSSGQNWPTRREALALAGGLAVMGMMIPENPVVGGTVLRRAAIQSPNFVTTVSGWAIRQDGSAEFNNVVIRNGQVISGTALFYSGVPAAGNLVASMSAAAGTDALGNAYVGGITSYSPSGVGVNFAVSLFGNSLVFYTGPSGSNGAGPWTSKASFALTAPGTQLQVIVPSQGVAISGGPTAVVTETISSGQAAGALLAVFNSTAAPTAPNVQIHNQAAADRALGIDVTGDTVPRLLLDSNGKLSWSTGALATDTDLYRSAAGILKTDNELDVAGLLKGLAGLVVSGGTADSVALSSNAAGGLALTVTSTVSGITNSLVRLVVNAAGDQWVGGRIAGDTANRAALDTDAGGLARLIFGPGNAAADVILKRLAANSLGVVSADLAIDTVGRGLQVKEGANAKQGTAVLSSGTKVVATTAVTANSRIFLTTQDVANVGTFGFLRVSARTAGTSFTVTSSSSNDAATFAWEIFEPAP